MYQIIDLDSKHVGRQNNLYALRIFVQLVHLVCEISVFTSVSAEMNTKISCLVSISTVIKLWNAWYIYLIKIANSNSRSLTVYIAIYTYKYMSDSLVLWAVFIFKVSHPSLFSPTHSPSLSLSPYIKLQQWLILIRIRSKKVLQIFCDNKTL